MSSFFNLFKSPSRKPSIKPTPIIIPPIQGTEDIPFDSSIPPSTPILIPHVGNLHPVGMSYWRNINFHRYDHFLKVILSVNDQLCIYTLSKYNLEKIDMSPLDIFHTGEGCFFSAHKANILYVPIGNEMLSIDITTGTKEIIFKLPNNELIWQAHSSYDEEVFSCTIKDANSYQIKEWGVSIFGNSVHRYPIICEPDECQIDKSGNWLLIKEDNYNRIIDIREDDHFIITNKEGALGHSDTGFNCAIGEDDYNEKPGALVLWDFETREKKLIYSTGIWNMGYFSFTNALDTEVEKQKGLITTHDSLVSVKLDGYGGSVVVCDNLTESQEYDNRPKANLCPDGDFACWTALVNGRLETYITRIPKW